MTLLELLESCKVRSVEGSTDLEIGSIVFDSANVVEGCCFVCLKGKTCDGHLFADLAVAKGACAVICMNDYRNPRATVVRVEDTRKTLSLLSAAFYGRPDRDLALIGVIGTNGKSTTAYLLREIMETCGRKTGLIGTMYCQYGNVKVPADMTTPDPVALQKLLRDMADAGMTCVVMEVSAHAIYLDKLYGIVFDNVIFTNFSQDHLDFFDTMERYKACKKSFFTPRHTRCAIVNADDELGREILAEGKIPCMSYGIESPADVFAIDIGDDGEGNRYVVNLQDEIFEAVTRLYGTFNVSNALGACAAARRMGLTVEEISRALESIDPPVGRFNVTRAEGITYIIDFAHTPDGLYRLLKEGRKLTRGRLITVFGCGGDRDVTKRPMMGRIAGELSDVVIVTSDNPRTESRKSIADDILSGVRLNGKLFVELDRSKAIALAAELASCGDTVIIAGKGSENYIEENNVKRPYSDYEELAKVIGGKL